ncbi:ABC transporter permease [Sulfurospirillum arcachonense]|uniref:ABC transporter permease n=1 Tax=Sulfurospirillum arcachonense TaxID=57666 RepID=UPI000469CD8D|nr:ABC transporter permease [Sulfurospirillum arcachonense]
MIALQKISYVVLMLLIICLISFGAIHLAPNSFFATGELNPNITAESIEQLKRVYGLDKSLPAQFISWLSAVVQLDFGISFASGKSVRDEILSRLPITLLLNIISLVLVFSISMFLGIKSALKQNNRFDKLVKQFSLFSYAMPSFYLALLLVIIFSVKFNLFPISGLHSVDVKSGFSYYIDFAWHLILPIFVMVFGGIGSLTMYIRSLTLSILKSDYIFFALSRGIKGNKLFRYFILPNISPPIVTILGLSLPGLIGGSVILESIFAINGMGLLFYQSALSRDYPVIMGILIVSAFLTLIGNIVADLVLLKLNPHYKNSNKV